ncbi:hypothetical protein E3N88_41305 [Mikania micrantha]|uniref:Transferase, Chloramphenicol acetyltransferase-like domain protein n=1 Tax=Mikania micrantha TaxID=192012 RepID=A0A5N6LSD6_9ASTR|nr:hypothetical protein E3N88_41305 [Mikania micrantha]
MDIYRQEFPVSHTSIHNHIVIQRVIIMKIVSRETIKPFTPTPSHLRTYNLSEMDLKNPRLYIPLVLFYPNNDGDVSLTTGEQKAIMLKKSLSQSLTRYYPFAGRLPSPASSYVDCNDEGVLFLEARNDTQLDTFQRMISSQDEALDQLFADDMVNFNKTTNTDLVAVQLTHFACGGLALAISFSHAIGDARTLSSFLSHWASMARYGSTDHKEPQEMGLTPGPENINVSKKFVFPNSRLNELKKKLAGGSVNNPTRFEVLASLLHKTLVESVTATSGRFKPSYLWFTVNMRDRLVPKLPQSNVGNLVKGMIVKTRHISEASLIESTKSFLEKMRNGDLENFPNGMYWVTSLCGFGFNKVDIGWGKPTGTSHALRATNGKVIMLMDTADDDGIEAMVFLENECMEIFENDKEMLSYCLPGV